jgi:hypothetical protein
VSGARYFVVGRLRGSPHTRYAVLHGSEAEVQISRPEGVEVPAPDHVRFVRPQFSGGTGAALYFNNVRSAARSQSLRRAGEKSQRAAAERRSLMPGGETDSKLALGRQRGAFRRAA